jgi:hypothetical protein
LSRRGGAAHWTLFPLAQWKGPVGGRQRAKPSGPGCSRHNGSSILPAASSPGPLTSKASALPSSFLSFTSLLPGCLFQTSFPFSLSEELYLQKLTHLQPWPILFLDKNKMPVLLLTLGGTETLRGEGSCSSSQTNSWPSKEANTGALPQVFPDLGSPRVPTYPFTPMFLCLLAWYIAGH